MFEPPPPYRPSQIPPQKRGPANISSLPLHLLHRIISLTLDPRATPSRFSGDEEEERVRRLWALFRGLRGVDRRFLLVSTSILRNHLHHEYLSHIPRGASSDPYPLSTLSSHPTSTSTSTSIPTSTSVSISIDETSLPSLLSRSRETAVFDRFIAITIGNNLRSTESSLSEESEAITDLFQRLQPCARIEDLLRDLPRSLVLHSGLPKRSIPLPHSHLSIQITPGWIRLLLNSHPIGIPTNGKIGRDTVLEVRRQDTAEKSVQRIREGLEDMQRGIVHWGERIL